MTSKIGLSPSSSGSPQPCAVAQERLARSAAIKIGRFKLLRVVEPSSGCVNIGRFPFGVSADPNSLLVMDPNERPQHGQYAKARRWTAVSQNSSHASIRTAVQMQSSITYRSNSQRMTIIGGGIFVRALR
ncbi:hypothetical protein ABIF83_005209 [Bradyrhizobium ottawaense]